MNRKNLIGVLFLLQGSLPCCAEFAGEIIPDANDDGLTATQRTTVLEHLGVESESKQEEGKYESGEFAGEIIPDANDDGLTAAQVLEHLRVESESEQEEGKDEIHVYSNLTESESESEQEEQGKDASHVNATVTYDAERYARLIEWAMQQYALKRIQLCKRNLFGACPIRQIGVKCLGIYCVRTSPQCTVQVTKIAVALLGVMTNLLPSNWLSKALAWKAMSAFDVARAMKAFLLDKIRALSTTLMANMANVMFIFIDNQQVALKNDFKKWIMDMASEQAVETAMASEAERVLGKSDVSDLMWEAVKTVDPTGVLALYGTLKATSCSEKKVPDFKEVVWPGLLEQDVLVIRNR